MIERRFILCFAAVAAVHLAIVLVAAAAWRSPADGAVAPAGGGETPATEQVSEGSEPAVQTGTEQPATGFTVHRVQPGESFWSIARRYNIPLPQLLAANGRNEGDALHVGAELRIPRR
jgi:LysM repeat protein